VQVPPISAEKLPSTFKVAFPFIVPVKFPLTVAVAFPPIVAVTFSSTFRYALFLT